MLERLSWKGAREAFRGAKVALIPVGSTEQHGPHLPLGTDLLIAQRLAAEAARETGAVCTPVIPIGVSEHHRQFWGTLWVPPATLRAYLHGIAQALAYHGLKRLVFVNGHGGNTAALQELARQLRAEGIYALSWQWWWAVSELSRTLFPGGGSHAGEAETSVALALFPELVDRTALEEAAAGAGPGWGITKFGIDVAFDTRDFSASGAVGDPRRAERAKGEQLYRAALQELISLIRWLSERPDGELRPKEHLP